jgi:uncharacterized membrane protein YqaE (UPF0057 family)
MRLLALFLPPVAVLLCGGAIFSAVLNFFLCFLFWIPGVIHAWGFVSDYKQKKQTDRIVKAINGK